MARDVACEGLYFSKPRAPQEKRCTLRQGRTGRGEPAEAKICDCSGKSNAVDV